MSPPKRTTEKDSPAASEEAGLVPTPATETPPPPNKKSEADRLIRQYIGWSCAGGLVPVPLLDIAAITAAQIQLVRELSALYGVPFQDHLGRNVVASLVGGVGSAAAGRGIFCSVLKAVPVIGTIGGLISVPIVAGSATYALGQVFVEHFEQGGTLLDFDPKPMRAFFETKCKEGQKVAKEVWAKTTSRSSR
jgi:uncharacterized protein (DUF697 family)